VPFLRVAKIVEGAGCEVNQGNSAVHVVGVLAGEVGDSGGKVLKAWEGSETWSGPNGNQMEPMLPVR
jgi:hypothetical protein